MALKRQKSSKWKTGLRLLKVSGLSKLSSEVKLPEQKMNEPMKTMDMIKTATSENNDPGPLNRPKSSLNRSIKIVAVSIVMVMVIVAVLFFIGKGTGQAISNKFDNQIPVNHGGIFLDSSVGDYTPGVSLPVRVNFGKKSVAIAFSYTVSGDVASCNFRLANSISAGDNVVLNTVSKCVPNPTDGSTSGEIEIAFLCIDRDCSNAFYGVETLGDLNLATLEDATTLNVDFSNFKYVDLDDDTNTLIDIVSDAAVINFETSSLPAVVCDVNHPDLCSGQTACEGANLFWYDNECHAEDSAAAEEPEPAEEGGENGQSSGEGISGDADGDGVVDIFDALAIVDAINSGGSVADYDCDDNGDIFDALIIVDYINSEGYDGQVGLERCF